MTENTTTTIVTGFSSGQVTCQKRRQPLAPSSDAASWRSGLMVCRPASSVIAKNGIPRHVFTTIAHQSPQVPSERKGSLVTMNPVWYRSQFRTLKVGSNIQRQAKVESTVGTMKGSSIEARTRRLPRKWRLSSSASHMPSDSLNTVAQNVYTNVFQKAVWKMESFHALRKFLNPTKCPGLPTLVLDRASQTPMTKG